MKIAFHYLGCRLNEAENELIARDLVAAGYQMVTIDDQPDVIVLNTCGVTGEAMRKSRKCARKLAAGCPRMLVLMGCAVDLMEAGENPVDDDEVASKAEENVRIVRILRKDKPNATRIILDAIRQYLSNPPQDGAESPKYRLRMRSFIKIEDGCNNQCTYCSVRLARGREESLPSQQIISEINRCIALGEKEFVLTGVQVGAWKEGDRRLHDLIRDILDHTQVQRLRLSSIEPWHTRPELWTMWHDTRLCPHFHIPVQSGCDEVLAAMKRRTPIDGYLDKISAIRSEIPNVRISTDLIVGFPGETDEMWQQTIAFIRRAAFDDVHLFRFSARPGTIAAALPNQIPPEIKHKRWYEAESLISEIRRQRLTSCIQQPCEVLWENICEKGGDKNCWYGYSKNYLRLNRWFDADRWMRGTVTQEIFDSSDIDTNLKYCVD